ncbi:MAG: substrate-binding domain-containing protein [Phycisphaerales bacterium]|nr:substrate-binding domain-containing protein [Phycisphaerales bacterium]
MMSILELHNISRAWTGRSGTVEAVKNAECTVNAGDFAVIRGPSGAGKSTLLLLAAGLLRPDSGTVRVQGVDPVQADGGVRSRSIGIVFQSMHLLPYLTARENVLVGVEGHEEETARADRLIEELGIQDRARHLPGELSVGERQRVAVARAMVPEPALVLADEPTGNLDPDTSDLVFTALDKWRSAPDRAVVLATHQPELPIDDTTEYRIERGTLRRGAANGAMLFLLGSILAAAILALLLVGLSRTTSTTQATNDSLRLYCAAGIKPAVDPAVTAFAAEHGIPIEIQYGGSGTLLSQLEIDPKGVDLYLAADDSYARTAKEKGLVREIIPLARMRPVIAVPSGNPAGITGVKDLANPDLRVGLANPDAAAVGRITRTALDAQGLWTSVRDNTQVLKPTVNELANDLHIGTIDAAIIWDATARQYDGIELVRDPILEAVPRTVVIAVTANSEQSPNALRFARFLASTDRGMPGFQDQGYEPLPGEPFEFSPKLLLFAGSMFNQAIEDQIRVFESREGVEVDRVYNGCGILVGQMRAGAQPDAYFACDQVFLDEVQSRFHPGLTVSSNPLVIAVAKGNPHQILSMADLSRAGLRIGLAHPEKSALGTLTRMQLKQAGQLEPIEMANTLKQDAPQGDFLVNALRTGALDAAIVYASNLAFSRDELDAVPIPDAEAVQPYAVAIDSPHSQTMQRLLDTITTPVGRDRFVSLGFDWRFEEPGE